MKCKICGYSISNDQEVCAGCGTKIEQLKSDGNIMEESSSEPVIIGNQEVQRNEENINNIVENSSMVNSSNEVSPVEDKIVEEPIEAPEEDKIVEEPIEAPVEDKIVEEPIEAPEEDKIVEEPIVAPVEDKIVEESIEAPVEDKMVEEPIAAPIEDKIVEAPIEAPVEDKIVEESIEQPTPEVQPVIDNSVVSVLKPEEPSVEPAKLEEVVPTSEEPKEAEKVEEQKDEPATDKIEEKTKKKGKAGVTILIVILVIILLLAGAAAYIHFVFGSPINTFSRVVNSTSSQLSNKVNDFNSYNDITANLSVKSPNLDQDLKVKTNIQVDTTKKGLVLDATIEQEESSSNYNFVLLNDNMYIYSKDIIDKYIKLDSIKNEDTENATTENSNPLVQKEAISRLIKGTSGVLSKSVDKSLLSKTYSKETINGKQQEVAKVTANLTKENIKQIVTSIISAAKTDDQSVKDLSLIMNKSEQEVKEMMDTEIKELSIDVDTLNLVIYTDLTTTKLYKVEITTQMGTYKDFVTYEKNDNGLVIDYKSTKNSVAVNLNTFNKLLSIKSLSEENEMEVNLNYDFKETEKVSYPDLTNAIDTENMSDEDKSIIMENSLKNPIFSLLVGGSLEEPVFDDKEYEDIKGSVESSNKPSTSTTPDITKKPTSEVREEPEIDLNGESTDSLE